MAKTTTKALSLALSIVMVFALTMVFAASMTAFAAINLDSAKQIALTDAGLTSTDVIFTEARLEGRAFDIEFRDGKIEYDYSISNEGEILSFAYDSNNRIIGSRTFDAAAAKTVALNFIGAKTNDVKLLRAEYDDSAYEVSFSHGNREYDITVSAVDGTITEYEYEALRSTGGIWAMITAFFQQIIDFFTGFFA